jgi:uncharacterized protein YndB with AHSA1/START domain
VLKPLDLWSPVEVCREIAASPESVFDVLAEPRTYPDWLVGAQRIRGVDADFPSKGAEFAHSVGPTNATTIDDATEVLVVDRPHRLKLLARAGLLRAQVDMLVELAGDGSVVRFRERPVGWAMVLTPLLRPGLAARNIESLRRLADLVEGHAPSTAAGGG